MESNEFFGGFDGLDKATKRYASDETVVSSEKNVPFYRCESENGKDRREAVFPTPQGSPPGGLTRTLREPSARSERETRLFSPGARTQLQFFIGNFYQ